MTPPYRADQVGSLLRPAVLAEARRQWKEGALEAAALKDVEDRSILEAVRRQEAIGLEAVTDGEFRRDWWHLDFLGRLDGVTTRENPGPKFGGTEEQPPIATVTGKVGCSTPIMTEHVACIISVAIVVPRQGYIHPL
jgi:5-methyltetrahydropteroyltriglutamate--homocysteine methyltransferase